MSRTEKNGIDLLGMEELEYGESVYENDHYVVDVLYISPEADPYVDGKFIYRTVYAVTNKATEVIEHVCIQLPEAIFCAHGLAAALDNAPWKKVEEVVGAAGTH